MGFVSLGAHSCIQWPTSFFKFLFLGGQLLLLRGVPSLLKTFPDLFLVSGECCTLGLPAGNLMGEGLFFVFSLRGAVAALGVMGVSGTVEGSSPSSRSMFNGEGGE